MSYYLAHIRNMEKQADVQRQLEQAKYQQSRISYSRIQNQLYEDKVEPISRKRQDEQTSVFLRRSRYQSQLDASTVSTNAILTRSRLQSAFELRQSKQHLQQQNLVNMQTQLRYQHKLQAMQEEQYLQKLRQTQLNQIKIQNYRQQIYRNQLQYQIQMRRKQELDDLYSTQISYSPSLYRPNLYPYSYY